ncbi:g2438 [Coccomyxa viridis]|uniref:G2438 protein n=1 Tax=Coccomyxa viridis TaxID=1274662 RepID=A0ABP1FPC6_9CHLO
MREDAFEEATRAHQNDSAQVRDGEAALAQPWTKAYFELDGERPFFDALGDCRGHIRKCEEHLATALSEMYVGSWAGRRWFFPTISYQSSSRPGSPRWHVPEQALKGVQARVQRTVRALYMIHCTFRDGFQGEVMEELQHHYPLDLLMAFSEASVGAMQEFVDSFPSAFVSPRQLMPATALIRLIKVTNELMELARASRANKVDLIRLGEHHMSMLERGIDPTGQAQTDSSAPGFTDELPGMRVLADKLHSSHKSSSFGAHGLFLFPNTDAGWLATTWWYSFHFLAQQLVAALVRLRVSLNEALPLLPGADIQDVSQSSAGTYDKNCKEGDQDGLAKGVKGSKKTPTEVQIAVE